MGMGAMGGRSGGRSGGRRGRSRGHGDLISEINVTPFVDVMLVLLIIFMVSAPLLTVGVPIDLPDSAANPLEGDTEPITVSIDGDGTIYLKDDPVELAVLVETLLSLSENGLNERIYVRGDRGVTYGAIMKVMGTMSAAGFKSIGLVTIEEQG
jgi:biopolymer transport protein TolR